MVRKPNSLRSQLVLWTMLPMVAVLAVSAMATYLIAFSVANRALDYSLQDTARNIATRIKLDNGVPEVNLPTEVRAVLEYDLLDRVYFDVQSRRYGSLGGRSNLRTPEIQPSPEGVFYDSMVDGQRARGTGGRGFGLARRRVRLKPDPQGIRGRERFTHWRAQRASR